MTDEQIGGNNEKELAQDIAANLNALKKLRGKLTEFEWTPLQMQDGSYVVAAPVDRPQKGYRAGEWLREERIVSEYGFIEVRPDEETELAGTDRYWLVALELPKVYKSTLASKVNFGALREAMSPFQQGPRPRLLTP